MNKNSKFPIAGKFLRSFIIASALLLTFSFCQAQTQGGLKPETKQWKEVLTRTVYVTGGVKYTTPPSGGISYTVSSVTCNYYTYSTECVKCTTGGTCSCTYAPPAPASPSASACGYAPYPPSTPPN